MQECCVCSSGSPKYRCPGCRDRYCSVSCCKTHKEQCIGKATEGVTDVSSSPPVRRAESLKYKGHLLDEDDESDRISEDRLKLLGESEELKYLLLNPHLRKLLVNLDHAAKKEVTVKECMQEPLFVEFADRCLSIIEPDEKENRSPELDQ
ncbi:zinc finger HIT domain-containing protein 3 [Spea bombifrons]|uniref:zinc finger HIT domain-containing protein 3 n=1 Tax=Spea bombifrons TaxID=233779 RepID=UPI00234B6F6E|nr:zinc finger HIT domain-containing protein 3 [Spea bombifrons]